MVDVNVKQVIFLIVLITIVLTPVILSILAKKKIMIKYDSWDIKQIRYVNVSCLGLGYLVASRGVTYL